MTEQSGDEREKQGKSKSILNCQNRLNAVILLVLKVWSMLEFLQHFFLTSNAIPDNTLSYFLKLIGYDR